jgi:hypothetical protein
MQVLCSQGNARRKNLSINLSELLKDILGAYWQAVEIAGIGMSWAVFLGQAP